MTLDGGQRVETESLVPVPNHRKLFWAPDGKLLEIGGDGRTWFAVERKPSHIVHSLQQDFVATNVVVAKRDNLSERHMLAAGLSAPAFEVAS
jgi:hypothetical protein